LAGALGTLLRSPVAGGEFRLDQLQQPGSRGLLPGGFVGGMAEPLTAAPRPPPDVDRLHPPGMGHVAVAAAARAHTRRARGHRARAARRRRGGAGAGARRGGCGPPPPPPPPATGAAVQAPPPPVVLAVVDRRPLGRVAGNHPRAPRPPLTGPGAPHAHRGVVVAAVLAMAALAPRGELAAWPPFARCLLGLELESARGGVPD